MVQRGEADILICKDRVEEMEDDVNDDAKVDANKNLDVKSRWMPFAQFKHVKPGSEEDHLQAL